MRSFLFCSVFAMSSVVGEYDSVLLHEYGVGSDSECYSKIDNSFLCSKSDDYVGYRVDGDSSFMGKTTYKCSEDFFKSVGFYDNLNIKYSPKYDIKNFDNMGEDEYLFYTNAMSPEFADWSRVAFSLGNAMKYRDHVGEHGTSLDYVISEASSVACDLSKEWHRKSEKEECEQKGQVYTGDIDIDYLYSKAKEDRREMEDYIINNWRIHDEDSYFSALYKRWQNRFFMFRVRCIDFNKLNDRSNQYVRSVYNGWVSQADGDSYFAAFLYFIYVINNASYGEDRVTELFKRKRIKEFSVTPIVTEPAETDEAHVSNVENSGVKVVELDEDSSDSDISGISELSELIDAEEVDPVSPADEEMSAEKIDSASETCETDAKDVILEDRESTDSETVKEDSDNDVVYEDDDHSNDQTEEQSRGCFSAPSIFSYCCSFVTESVKKVSNIVFSSFSHVLSGERKQQAPDVEMGIKYPELFK